MNRKNPDINNLFNKNNTNNYDSNNDNDNNNINSSNSKSWWMNNPVFDEISKEKFEILNSIIERSQNIDSKKLISFIISESSKAASMGINFTNEETALLIDVITKDMSEEQKKKVNSVRKFAEMISKKNRRK